MQVPRCFSSCQNLQPQISMCILALWRWTFSHILVILFMVKIGAFMYSLNVLCCCLTHNCSCNLSYLHFRSLLQWLHSSMMKGDLMTQSLIWSSIWRILQASQDALRWLAQLMDASYVTITLIIQQKFVQFFKRLDRGFPWKLCWLYFSLILIGFQSINQNSSDFIQQRSCILGTFYNFCHTDLFIAVV